jgi:hypothetical protein
MFVCGLSGSSLVYATGGSATDRNSQKSVP